MDSNNIFLSNLKENNIIHISFASQVVDKTLCFKTILNPDSVKAIRLENKSVYFIKNFKEEQEVKRFLEGYKGYFICPTCLKNLKRRIEIIERISISVNGEWRDFSLEGILNKVPLHVVFLKNNDVRDWIAKNINLKELEIIGDGYMASNVFEPENIIDSRKIHLNC